MRYRIYKEKERLARMALTGQYLDMLLISTADLVDKSALRRKFTSLFYPKLIINLKEKTF